MAGPLTSRKDLLFVIDIQRYQSHQNCKMIIWLVYDPEGIIKNHRGLENDLTQQHNK
jgi:hypothetical protein